MEILPKSKDYPLTWREFEKLYRYLGQESGIKFIKDGEYQHWVRNKNGSSPIAIILHDLSKTYTFVSASEKDVNEELSKIEEMLRSHRLKEDEEEMIRRGK